MAYNPNILTDVLRARSLTPDQLSRRLKIEPSQLKRELGREPEPGQGILNKIAKELAVPSFTFFREKSPPLHDVIPDFRSPTAAPTTKSRETIQSIQFAEGVQKALSESDDIADKFPKFTATKLDEVDAFRRPTYPASRSSTTPRKLAATTLLATTLFLPRSLAR